ncbi:YgaP family membrane protein [Yoonia sp.]|uniref:YgaP family membrane protein n=1 Tax=Yoonia sp. TaxID=2212373 RepID=UPI003F6C2CF2
MTANVGTWDRLLRIILGVALIVAPLINFMGLGSTSTLAYTLMGIGVILVVTGAFKFCPLYRLFGVSTCQLG